MVGVFLALQFWTATSEAWVILFLFPSFLWHWAQRRELYYLDAIFLVFLTIASLVGVLFGGSQVLALLVILAGIGAWDLSRFMRILPLVEDEDEIRRMTKNHFLRLGVLVGMGVVLPLLAYSFRTELRLGFALLLAFLAILGLSRLVNSLSRISQ
jgi:hypothetical protein